MPLRVRHCKCRHHLAPTSAHVLHDLARLNLTLNQALELVAYLDGSATHRHDLALSRVSAPDVRGHMYWTGPRPLRGGPQVQWQGRRVAPRTWLHLRSGGSDVPLRRTCHDPQCISPQHHVPADADAGAHLQVMHARLALFDSANPKINYRPKSWDRSDPRGAHCLAYGHPLSVYDEARRYTYCKGCAALERARAGARAALAADINRDFSNDSYVPPRNPLADLDAIPDGPTLTDTLFAEAAEHVD